MLRAVGDQRGAGALCRVLHLIPFGRVVEGLKHDAADQREVMFGQRGAQNGRVFGHEADGAKFDPAVACRGAIREHLLPGWVARVICKFHAPGTGRIADTDGHGATLNLGARCASGRRLMP